MGKVYWKNVIYNMEKIKQSKDVPVIIYIISALSLIPLLGAFVGLTILILGITYFKNRILIVIGSIGILITIGIYGSLFYFGTIQRGGVCDEMTESLTAYSLETLVKEIELYKIRNEHYPDNLIQVTKNGYNQLHIDPILQKISSKNESKEFYYKLESDGYLLFSVGFDKIPFTNDDIYPSLEQNEIEKYGYMVANKPNP